MNISEIIASIDEEISKLQKARAILSDGISLSPNEGRGSPKRLKSPTQAKSNSERRPLSEEARARIAAAQKKRWAAYKGANAK